MNNAERTAKTTAYIRELDQDWLELPVVVGHRFILTFRG